MNQTQKEDISRLRGKGSTYTAIAAALKLSENTVKSYCQRNGLGKNKPQSRHCAHCDIPIVGTQKTKPKKFCSDKCRAAWWAAHPEKLRPGKAHTVDCASCGATFHASVSTRRKYCSHACYIQTRFKGGAAE